MDLTREIGITEVPPPPLTYEQLLTLVAELRAQILRLEEENKILKKNFMAHARNAARMGAGAKNRAQEMDPKIQANPSESVP